MSVNREFVNLLASGAARDFIANKNESAIINQISNMTGPEAAYFVVCCMEHIGEMQGNTGPSMRALLAAIEGGV